jgi:hypothetical protein
MCLDLERAEHFARDDEGVPRGDGIGNDFDGFGALLGPTGPHPWDEASHHVHTFYIIYVLT